MVKISDLEALELLARLPDDVPLTVSEAAIFLRVSKSALDKMRRPDAANPGPVYSQGGARGSSGSNQKVLYLKGDLKAWLQANRCSDTLEAAKRRGQLFATAADLLEPEAFWRNMAGEIAGLVEETLVAKFFEQLGRWEIEWLALGDALKEPWSDQAEQMRYLWLFSSKSPESGSALTEQLMLKLGCRS